VCVCERVKYCVCVCVCAREREREYVCVSDLERGKEGDDGDGSKFRKKLSFASTIFAWGVRNG